jgi:hypothetical protein
LYSAYIEEVFMDEEDMGKMVEEGERVRMEGEG